MALRVTLFDILLRQPLRQAVVAIVDYAYPPGNAPSALGAQLSEVSAELSAEARTRRASDDYLKASVDNTERRIANAEGRLNNLEREPLGGGIFGTHSDGSLG